MKKEKLAVTVLALALAACGAQAQQGGGSPPPPSNGDQPGCTGGDEHRPPPPWQRDAGDRGNAMQGERPPPPPMGQERGGQDRARRPVPPLIAALDLNADGIIDAAEIAKASESLKKLDKNGDGKLTPDECRPPRPEGPGGPPRGQRFQDGARDQGFQGGPGPQDIGGRNERREGPGGDWRSPRQESE